MKPRGYQSPKTPPTSLPPVESGPASGYVPPYHEVWCGVRCPHEDCGMCTCPRQQREAAHPHFDTDRRNRGTCPDAYLHHLAIACDRCGWREARAPRPAKIGIWTTPTTSSGQFDDAKRTLNADLRRAECEDGWSDSDKRFFAITFLALLELACLIYLSIRGVR